MFDWVGNIVHGVVITFMGALAIFGVGSPITYHASSTPVIEVQASTSISEIDQLKQALDEEKAARLKLEQEIGSTTQKKSTGTVPLKVSSLSTNTTKTKTFTTPSGAVVDENGNVISLSHTESLSPNIIAGKNVLTTSQIAALLSPSVALLSTPDGTGSGVVIEGGKYILTNEHVVGNNSSITISLPNYTSFVAPVLGKNASVDLALIYVGDHKLPAALLGSSDTSSLATGDDVFALGYPYGLSNLTLTRGILSSRQVIVEQSRLQTDAAINPGNSGGPLLNDKGEVIGINVSRLSDTLKAQGIGFAIPIDTARAWIPSLSQYGQSRYEIYPVGSTYSIKRSLIIKIGYNGPLTCDQLGLVGNELTLCDLYKNHQPDYNWKIIEDI